MSIFGNDANMNFFTIKWGGLGYGNVIYSSSPESGQLFGQCSVFLELFFHHGKTMDTVCSHMNSFE